MQKLKLFFFLFIPIIGQSQNLEENIYTTLLASDYDISTYVRPDLKRQTLSIVPDFSFRNIFNKGESNDNFSFFVHTSPSLWQSKFINTSDQQKTVTNRADFAASFGSSTDVDGQTFFSLRVERHYNRKKFKAEQKFWEIGYHFIGDYGVEHKKLSNQLEAKKSHRLYTNLGFSVYKGKGRVEIVTDAWHAATIFEVLEDYGLLKEAVSKEQIHGFAELISEIKNTRRTDSRLEQISEYSQLCTYLINSDLVKETDYDFFAVLRDAWTYEAFIHRRSGHEFKIGFSPDFEIRTENFFSVQENPEYISSTDLDISVIYNIYKPLSLDWQFDQTYNLKVGLSFFEHLTKEISFLPATRVLNNRLEANWTWSYVPNRRTHYNLGANFSSGLYKPLIENDLYDFRYSFRLALTGNYEYYVSPKLSWTIKGRIDVSTFTSEFATPKSFSNTNNLSFSANYRFY